MLYTTFTAHQSTEYCAASQRTVPSAMVLLGYWAQLLCATQDGTGRFHSPPSMLYTTLTAHQSTEYCIASQDTVPSAMVLLG